MIHSMSLDDARAQMNAALRGGHEPKEPAAEQASQPPGGRDWGQGARGTRPSREVGMNDRIRAAVQPIHHPAHASPGRDGRIN